MHCAVVLDAYPRRVVGWSIDASPTAALVTNALGMAIDSRTPPPGTVIHSDRGVQFGSWAFTDRAKASGLVPSMGSIADCYDNAMIESFRSRMQVELLNRQGGPGLEVVDVARAGSEAIDQAGADWASFSTVGVARGCVVVVGGYDRDIRLTDNNIDPALRNL